MRTLSRRRGFVLGSVVAAAWLFHHVPVALAAPQSFEKMQADDRDDIANKLLDRISLKEPLNFTLREALAFLTEKHGLTVLVDYRSFNGGNAPAAFQDGDALDNLKVIVPAVKNVRLGTVLKLITDQMEGVYLIYPDHIKIVSAARAQTLTKPSARSFALDEEQGQLETNADIIRSIPLVTIGVNEKPLVEVLKEIEYRTNATVILANQAAGDAKTLVSARFTNVPVDRAVATLAEMAGLKMAQKGNVFLVTTAERAKIFDPVSPQPAQGFAAFASGDPNATEELKKKIAELEKAIEDLKQKK